MQLKNHCLAVALGALMLSGCAQQDVAADRDSAITDIRYRVGPCHGICPVYSVDLRENGAVRFVGERFTAVEGEREKPLDSERFTQVKQRLSAWQPAMGTTVATAETSRCGPRATDFSHYTVTWTRRDGETAVLEHDGGCRSEDSRQLTDALRSLPETLDISSWVQR